MEKQSNWEAVKEFYKEKFDLDGKLVELNANYTILLMCASGASNESIATFLEIPEHSVELILNEVFGFTGWKKDMDYNPYKLYRESNGDMVKFRELFTSHGVDVSFSLYLLCRGMKGIDDRLENEWV